MTISGLKIFMPSASTTPATGKSKIRKISLGAYFYRQYLLEVYYIVFIIRIIFQKLQK